MTFYFGLDTGYQYGQSLTTHYLLDGETTVAATANGQTTYYLNGVGEYGTEWIYYLADGMGSVRQTTDGQGQITGRRSYSPWGEILEQSGQSELTSGYLGGRLDAVTGLIYIGNGQYYDPATGRFLTRSANPNQTNPYVPWKSDPVGSMLAPLAILAMVYGRKKKGKWDQLVIVVVLCLSAGVGLTACNGSTPTPTLTYTTPQPTSTPTPSPSSTYTTTVTATYPSSTSTPTPTLTVTCTVTMISTVTPDDVDVLNSNGYRAKAKYDELNSRSGWWNKHKVGGFTIEQFLGIFMLYEADGHRTDTGDKVEYYVKEIVGYQLWANTKLDDRGGNSPYCTHEPCFNGALNFMGGYQGGYLMSRFNQITDDMDNSNGHPRLSRILDNKRTGDIQVIKEEVVDECIIPTFEKREIPGLGIVGVRKDSLICEAESLGKHVLHKNRAKYQAGDFSIEFSNSVEKNLPYHWGNDMNDPNQPFLAYDIDFDLLYKWPEH